MADLAELGFKVDTGGLKNATSDLDKMSSASGRAEKSTLGLTNAKRDLKRAALAGAAAIVGVAAAIAKLTSDGMASVDAQAKLARSLQGTADGIRAVQLAASEAGVEGMDQSLAKLNRRLGAAQMGVGEFYKTTETLGLNLKELQDMDVDKRVAAIGDAVKNAGLSSQETARHLQQLGFTQAQANDFFRSGGDAIREARTAVDAYGLSVSAVDAAKVESANDAWARTALVIEGVQNKMAVEFADILKFVSDLINDAAKDGEGFGSAIEKGFEKGVRAAAFVVDAVEGVRRVFVLAGQGMATFALQVVNGALTVTEAIVSGSTDAVNGLIRLLNLLPHMDIKFMEQSDLSKGLRDEMAVAQMAVEAGVAAMNETLSAPMPSVGLLDAFEKSKAASQAAAEQITADRERERAAFQSTGEAAAVATEGLAELLETMRRQADPAYAAMRDIEKVFDDLTTLEMAGMLDPGEWDELFDKLTVARDGFDTVGEEASSAYDHIADGLSSIASSAGDAGAAINKLATFMKIMAMASKIAEEAKRAESMASAGAAISKQGAEGDPYTAFARVAAMAALMASLVGFGGSGGSASVSESRQNTQGTGTVMGDADAKSEAILNANERISDYMRQLVGINRDMLDAMRGVSSGIVDSVGIITRATPWAGIAGGFGRNIDEGLQISAAGGAFDAQAFSTRLGETGSVTDEGFKIIGRMEFMNEVSDELSASLNSVYASITDAVKSSAFALGALPADVQSALDSFVAEAQLISLKGLTAEEQAEELNAVFSTIFDNMAMAVTPYIDEFIGIGESAGEVLVEIATRVMVTEEAMTRLGFTAERLAVDQFAKLSNELIDAAGGVDEFISGMDSFIKKFSDDAHQFGITTRDMSGAFARVGLAVPRTRDEMMGLMRSLDATTAEGREQIAMLLEITDTADSYYKTLERGASGLSDSYTRNADDVRNLITQYDGSVRAQESLSAAYAIAQTSATALSYALIDAGTYINGLFGGLAQTIREQMMSEEELYAHRQVQVDALMASLAAMTDPAEMMRAADEIERITSEMWRSLAPEQRDEMAGGFLDFLDDANALVQQNISALDENIMSDMDRLSTSVMDAMTPIADSMMQSAFQQAESISIFARAADQFSQAATMFNQVMQRGITVNQDGQAGGEITYA